MLREPTTSASERLMRLGQSTDAYLLAAGMPVGPAPWPTPTPEQVEQARRVQTIPDTRREQ